MTTDLDLGDSIPTLIQWATERDTVRAMLVTSTRAVPNAAVDALSDYDVILIVDDILRAWRVTCG